MTASSVALHKAKHLLSHALAAAGSRRWPLAMHGESGETPTGFYADFALSEAPGDEDLAALTDEMAKVLQDSSCFRDVQLKPEQALTLFAHQPWKRHQVETLAELGPRISCFEIDGFYDVCDCALKDTRELRAIHPEKFMLTGASLVAWINRGKEQWFSRISGELFPAPPPCECCT